IKNGLVMLASVLVFTLVGSWVASLVPTATMGGFSVVMTFLLGIKFIVKPVMTTKESQEQKSPKQRFIGSVLCGVVIGFICGFIGAGGGMMLLLILSGVLGYELKTAVGTSVFIMTFTALTGAVSHIAIAGALPDLTALGVCVLFTFIGARASALFANKASAATLNRVTGVVLAVLGAAMIVMNFFVK
ncbi:MAG: sulfite exporter TauE/SafE family protein, partial [Oscillospiraceae bacterium]